MKKVYDIIAGSPQGWMLRKDLEAQAKLGGGRLSTALTDLETAGLIVHDQMKAPDKNGRLRVQSFYTLPRTTEDNQGQPRTRP